MMRDVLAQSLQFAYGHIIEPPVVAHVAQGVVFHCGGCQMRDELLVLELVQREVYTCLADAVEVLHEGYHAGIHLQLHIVGIGGVLLAALILVLKRQTLDASAWDNLCAQVESHGRNDGRTDEVGSQEASETHAGTDHGYYLAVVGQLRSEEDDTQKDEERAEEVGEVGDEVEIILEDDGVPSGVVRGELIHVLVEVKHHSDTDNQQYGEEVCPQELCYQISVDACQESWSHALLYLVSSYCLRVVLSHA